jgi:bacterioferritin
MGRNKPEFVKITPALKNLLNDAVAREIQASIQYMWQRVQWSSTTGLAIKDELQSIAVMEMKHAQAIAERLFNLGEKPTTKPSPIFVGDTVTEMIENDIKAEEEAIKMYKQIIDMTRKVGDEITNRLFRDILQQEEAHQANFDTLLKGLAKG